MESRSRSGHKDPRNKIGEPSYYKGRYHIAFYKEEGQNEILYAGFDNALEICRYLKASPTPQTLNAIYQSLYRCLFGDERSRYTKLIDGIKLKAYLIDMSEENEEIERRENMKKFIKINSMIDVEVYPDLGAIDATNPNAPMADRLSVKPDWVYPVLIRKGIHSYPSEVAGWKSVKRLAEKNLLSISEGLDEPSEEDKQMCEEMSVKMKRVASRQSAKKETKKEEPKVAAPEEGE